jgi:hypothetical protein
MGFMNEKKDGNQKQKHFYNLYKRELFFTILINLRKIMKYIKRKDMSYIEFYTAAVPKRWYVRRS